MRSKISSNEVPEDPTVVWSHKTPVSLQLSLQKNDSYITHDTTRTDRRTHLDHKAK